ncbi:hypothetical protein FA95DRAFT_1597019 [Auriscalpium vulgare]|uniref:Uncharacterized protein n=1 Tax=Auriscalpium vulgare TaxID=40419 RepID=A0ACB8RLK4_9AGAM|nr:hypothetical protein FA95DRAFT_1597019 [Auriscalpium vulgare]
MAEPRIYITPYDEGIHKQRSSEEYEQLGLEPQLEHCARCHRSFYDVDNTPASCMIPHIFDVSSETVDPATRDKRYVSACCGPSVILVNEYETYNYASSTAEMCVQGYHTPEHRDVYYCEVNILPCKLDLVDGDYYCNRRAVDVLDGHPNLFAWDVDTDDYEDIWLGVGMVLDQGELVLRDSRNLKTVKEPEKGINAKY